MDDVNIELISISKMFSVSACFVPWDQTTCQIMIVMILCWSYKRIRCDEVWVLYAILAENISSR
jgi:hypothetical protein